MDGEIKNYFLIKCTFGEKTNWNWKVISDYLFMCLNVKICSEIISFWNHKKGFR